MPPSREQRIVLAAIALAVVWTLGLTVLLYERDSIGARLAEMAEPGGRLARLATAPSAGDPAVVWASRVKAVSVRMTLAIYGGLFLLACYALRRRDWAVTRYFQEADDPVQLAVVRILVFIMVLYLLATAAPLSYAGLPADLTSAPFPWQRLLRNVSFPYTPSLIAYCVVLVGAVCGLLGLWTRAAALTVALVGSYVFLLPQSFGKVNHMHIVVWFPLVLAFSRAGDMLSLDAVRRSLRAAQHGELLSFAPSREYALPTRIIWLLLAQVYFFPGFYKFFSGNYDGVFEWPTSDSLRTSIAIAHYIRGTDAFLPLENFPWLCRAAAIGVVFWELAWPLLLMFPRWRVPLALSAMLFHTMTDAVMQISFVHLRWMMLALFPWHAILGAAGRAIFSHPARYLFDSQQPTQLAIANLIGSFNLWGQALAEPTEPRHAPARICLGNEVVDEQTGWAALCRRLGFPGPLGRKGLLWVSLLAKQPRPADTIELPAAQSRRLTRGLVGVGLLCLGANCFFAVIHIHAAWPFAVFPTFEVVHRHNNIWDIEIEMLDPAGKSTRFDNQQAKKALRSSIWFKIYTEAFAEPDEAQRRDRLAAIWKLLATKGLVDPTQWDRVRIYRLKMDVFEDRNTQVPLQRELLLEIPAAVDSVEPSRLEVLESA